MASVSLKVRPIIEEDLRSFYDESFSQSLRGLTVEMDGLPVLVAFVVNTNPPQAVSWVKDELRKHPKWIMRAAMEFKKVLNRYPCDVYAVADDEEENSENFLKRIGFEHLHERSYIWAK
jgi:hypothetical protein